jgi:hypothetical protein
LLKFFQNQALLMQEYIEECEKIEQCDRMGGFQANADKSGFMGREEDFSDR